MAKFCALVIALGFAAGCTSTAPLGAPWADHTPHAQCVVEPEQAAAALIAKNPALSATTVSGTSMQPLIAPGDVAVLQPEAYDHLIAGQTVARYSRARGCRVLHVLIAYDATRKTWRTAGIANCDFDDDTMSAEDFCGVLVALYRQAPVPDGPSPRYFTPALAAASSD